MRLHVIIASALLCLSQQTVARAPAAVPGPQAVEAARHAVTAYRKDVVDSLAAMFLAGLVLLAGAWRQTRRGGVGSRPPDAA